MIINLPPDLTAALKQYSQDNGISVDQAACEILRAALNQGAICQP